jgi:hypothetical protein
MVAFGGGDQQADVRRAAGYPEVTGRRRDCPGAVADAAVTVRVLHRRVPDSGNGGIDGGISVGLVFPELEAAGGGAVVTVHLQDIQADSDGR